jgi:hypothetical protein
MEGSDQSVISDTSAATEEDHGKSQSGLSVSRPRPEPGTYRIQISSSPT